MTKYLRHVFTFKNPTVNYSQQVDFGKISERFKNSIISQKEDNIFELIVKKRITHPIDISKNEARIEAASLLDRLSLITGDALTF